MKTELRTVLALMEDMEVCIWEKGEGWQCRKVYQDKVETLLKILTEVILSKEVETITMEAGELHILILKEDE